MLPSSLVSHLYRYTRKERREERTRRRITCMHGRLVPDTTHLMARNLHVPLDFKVTIIIMVKVYRRKWWYMLRSVSNIGYNNKETLSASAHSRPSSLLCCIPVHVDVLRSYAAPNHYPSPQYDKLPRQTTHTINTILRNS